MNYLESQFQDMVPPPMETYQAIRELQSALVEFEGEHKVEGDFEDAAWNLNLAAHALLRSLEHHHGILSVNPHD